LLFGADAARGAVVGEIRSTVGTPVAQAVEQLLATNEGSRGAGMTIVGIATLLFGAAGVFGQLQDALNTVWGVKPKPGLGIREMIRARFLSLSMVLGSGFLLLVSLIASATLAALGSELNTLLPGGTTFWRYLNVIVSFLLFGVLFAMIYKWLPDVHIGWRDVWIGALLTAGLFSLGKFLIGWYLGRASTTSSFGAAGSLVIILIWVYYASQIVLFGAVFTRVHAAHRGTEVKPTHMAHLAPGSNPVTPNYVDPVPVLGANYQR
jgi:membrane protein